MTVSNSTDTVLFLEHALDSVFVAAGDLLLLTVVFAVFRVRAVRLRRIAYGATLLHATLAFVGLSPQSLISISLYHRSSAELSSSLGALDTVVLSIWVVGALIALARRARIGRRMRAVVEGWLAVSESDIDETAARVRAALTRCGAPATQRFALIPLSVSPCVVGAKRPVLLFPTELAPRLTDDELDAVVAHELAHVESHDAALHLGLDLLTATLWFNPFLRWGVSAFRGEGEKLRDASAALRCGPRSLAGAIVKAVEFTSNAPSPPLACTPLVHGGFRRTRNRLRTLVRSAPTAWTVVPQLVIVLTLVPWYPATTRSVQIREVAAVGASHEHHSYRLAIAMSSANPWIARPVAALLRRIDGWPSPGADFLAPTIDHESAPR